MKARMAAMGARLALFLVIGAVLAPAPAAAQQPGDTVTVTVERTHTVRAGDTLWDIARAYFENAWLWPRIFDANRDEVENPHWIYPNEVLRLPDLDSLARVVMEAPDLLGAPVVLGEAFDPSTTLIEEEPAVQAEDVAPTVLTTVDVRRPVVSASEYRVAPWLVADTARLPYIGRVVRLREPGLESGRLSGVLPEFEQVVLGELRDRPSVGDTLAVVQLGRDLDRYGRVVQPRALLRVDSVTSTVVIATVERLLGEARVGDAVVRLAPVPEIGAGQPIEIAGGQEGRIAGFVVDQLLYRSSDIGFIDLGTRNGMAIGDELDVYTPQSRMGTLRSEVIPPEYVGRLRVVRVDDRTATVRVVHIENVGLKAGLPVRVVARMPEQSQ